MEKEKINNQQELIKWFPAPILERFTIYNYNHAAEIFSQSFSKEFQEILDALLALKIDVAEILTAGGNESPIPPKFNRILEPLGWKEIRISGDLVVKFYPRKGNRKGRFSDTPNDQRVISNYIDGHNIDFVKGRIALDIEWNSKDQTFDRDLFAMRTYYECDVISGGIIVTRDSSLDPLLKKLGVMEKYGASTTWMGKLLPRLDSRRHGGCPILAIGITPQSVAGTENEE